VKTTSKSVEWKKFSFRVSQELYADYAKVAEFRGMDMSALLNWVLVEYRPTLLGDHARNIESMRQAMNELDRHGEQK